MNKIPCVAKIPLVLVAENGSTFRVSAGENIALTQEQFNSVSAYVEQMLPNEQSQETQLTTESLTLPSKENLSSEQFNSVATNEVQKLPVEHSQETQLTTESQALPSKENLSSNKPKAKKV